jgi:hypothetical protein
VRSIEQTQHAVFAALHGEERRRAVALAWKQRW